jgi:hypothetical protein
MNVFLNLDSSDFLIEYIYYGATGAADTINTNDAPFYLMQNGHDGSSILLNDDASDSVTNNTRNRSVAQINAQSKDFALLTPNKLGPVYNDYDDKLTDTASLPVVFGSPEGVIYDTVRIHFIQGFSFNDYFAGINLDINVKDNDGLVINLLSAIYRVQDNYEIMNPNPFLYSGRQYSSYVEYKVPSLRYLINSYNNRITNDILSYKITNGKGFYDNTLLNITAGKFSETLKQDNQLYTRRITAETTSISAKDDFADIGVYVKESTDGDYIDFYGTYNGAIFGDYMQRLNNSGTGRYIAIHKLTITEQLPNTTGQYVPVGKYNPLTNKPDLSDNGYLANFADGNYWIATETGYNANIQQNVAKGNFVVYNPSLPGVIKVEVIDSFDIESYGDIAQFIRTGDQEFIQDDNFDDPNNFRPVLKYGGSALSYRINYTLQIFNTNTNATIEKSGALVSFEPQKYGKELLKLNTRDNIQVFNVFNKKTVNNIANTNTAPSSQAIEGTSLYSKNITSFKQVKDVYSGVTEVSINSSGQVVPRVNPEAVANIKGQGTATVYISPFDTFLQFGIYEKIEDGSFRSIDLNKIGEIFMNFTNKTGEILKVAATANKHVDSSKGQVVFRIKPELYNQVIGSGNDVFYITSKVGDNSPETPLYTGKYKEYATIVEDETTILIGQQRQSINDLNDEIDELERKLALRPDVVYRYGPTGKAKQGGQTANDKSINKKSMNVKTTSFNPFGPTSGSNTGPTSGRGPTGRVSLGPTFS